MANDRNLDGTGLGATLRLEGLVFTASIGASGAAEAQIDIICVGFGADIGLTDLTVLGKVRALAVKEGVR